MNVKQSCEISFDLLNVDCPNYFMFLYATISEMLACVTRYTCIYRLYFKWAG